MKIWFGSYFLPHGITDMLENLNEHIITPVSALFGKARSGGFSQNISSLIKPEKIVANSAGKRSVLYSTVPGLSLIHILKQKDANGNTVFKIE